MTPQKKLKLINPVDENSWFRLFLQDVQKRFGTEINTTLTEHNEVSKNFQKVLARLTAFETGALFINEEGKEEYRFQDEPEAKVQAKPVEQVKGKEKVPVA